MHDWERDVSLLERWKQGDKTAGRELYERHVGAVIGFLRNKLPPDRVETFVHDTFIRALDAIAKDKLRDPKAFRSFLIGIAKNLVIAHNRRAWRECEFDPARHSTADVSPGPFSCLARHEEERILLKALRRLPFESQVLLELVYFEEFGQQAAAEVVGISYSVARNKISRARKQLEAIILSFETSPELLTSTVGNIENWAAAVRERIHKSDSTV